MAENKYGTITVGTAGDSKQLAISDYIRAQYADHRLVSVVGIEDGSTVLLVENPESSGRATSQNMRLSKESLIGLLSTIMLYYSLKGINLEAELKAASTKDKIEYSGSDNLDLEFKSDGDASNQTED